MAELMDARVTVSTTQVSLSYEVSDTLPEAGHWLLSTTFVGGADGPIDQLGFKVVDGRLTTVFAFDHSGGPGQRHYQATPNRTGSRWTIQFPREAVRGVSGQWNASLDVNGRDSGSTSGEF